MYEKAHANAGLPLRVQDQRPQPLQGGGADVAPRHPQTRQGHAADERAGHHEVAPQRRSQDGRVGPLTQQPSPAVAGLGFCCAAVWPCSGLNPAQKSLHDFIQGKRRPHFGNGRVRTRTSDLRSVNATL